MPKPMNNASSNLRLGIPLAVAAMFVFAAQDGFSRHLAATYNVVMIVMVRYWFFGLFIVGQSVRSRTSLREVARTRQPLVQIARECCCQSRSSSWFPGLFSWVWSNRTLSSRVTRCSLHCSQNRFSANARAGIGGPLSWLDFSGSSSFCGRG